MHDTKFSLEHLSSPHLRKLGCTEDVELKCTVGNGTLDNSALWQGHASEISIHSGNFKMWSFREPIC
jgi:hypothetical protein